MSASTNRDRQGEGKNIIAKIARETAVSTDIKLLLNKRKRARNV